MSLRAGLTIGTACTLALAICAGFVAAYLVVRGQLRGEIDRALEERAAALGSLGPVRTAEPNSPPGRVSAGRAAGSSPTLPRTEAHPPLPIPPSIWRSAS